MAKSWRKSFGRWGESQAASYLEERGYEIVDRNVYTPYGEIDLIALADPGTLAPSEPGEFSEGPVLVFVEVKTRSSYAYGYPEDSIGSKKADHMQAAAEAYLQTHPELEIPWRVDVIAIERNSPKESPIITHFENAIGGN